MVVRFGRYHVLRNERFAAGEFTLLDAYDGFGDQSLDLMVTGDRLDFLLDHETQRTSLFSHGTVISGSFEQTHCALHVERVQHFPDFRDEAALSLDDEGCSVVDRAIAAWERVLPLKSSPPPGPRSYGAYRSVGPPLPRASHVMAASRGATLEPVDLRLEKMLLERRDGDDSIIVTILGSNDPGSCMIFKIADPESYVTALQAALERAWFQPDIDYWTYLLG